MIVFSIVWLLVMIGDILLPFFLALFYKGYCHREMALSVLGCRQSPVKWIYNIWCIFSGLIFVIGGIVLFSEISMGCCILLIVYGIGCEIISGFFPLSEERRENLDTSAKIHGIASAVGFMCLLFVPLCLGIAVFSTWAGFSVYSFFSFICALIGFVFFVMGEKEAFQKTILRFGGLWQRIVLIFCYFPIIGYLLIFLL